MIKPPISSKEIKSLVTKQVEDRFHRHTTVTSVEQRWTENGYYADVKLKVEGINKTILLSRPSTSFYGLERYDIIDEAWDEQFNQEVKKMFKENGFGKIKFSVATADVPDNLPIDVSKFPTIQEIRKKYGQKFESNDIQVHLQKKYPEDKKSQLEENGKILSLLKDIDKRGIGKNLFLRIQYLNNNKIFDIEYDSPETNPYHKPEDIKKAQIR
ncbi:hypothetical protein [Scopulibacillus daqui]|nr:hypothetical protein [Scopulibacillus daqui]